MTITEAIQDQADKTVQYRANALIARLYLGYDDYGFLKEVPAEPFDGERRLVGLPELVER